MLASVLCLAQAIYFEARSESYDGKLLVAEVVINRTQHEEFPDKICEVIHQEDQFPWADEDLPIDEPKEWFSSVVLAGEILTGETELLNTEALYFHSGKPDRFFKTRERIGRYGNHTFYK